MKTLASVKVSPQGAVLDGKLVSAASVTGLYREFVGDYPKFFKMDQLCRLGFIAAELLLRGTSESERENAAIVLFNRNGSLVTDRNYQQTIADDGYFPSPALFVYTLANIVTGEIAIRNRIFGETSFYVLSAPDAHLMDSIVREVCLTSSPSFVLTGWVDYDSEDDYLADMRIVSMERSAP